MYADLLMKFESMDQAVAVLERGLEEIQAGFDTRFRARRCSMLFLSDLCRNCKKKRQPRNHLIKRLVYMEERRGDEERAQEWRNQLV